MVPQPRGTPLRVNLVAQWVEHVLGAPVSLHELGHRGTEAQVWRVHRSEELCAYLKVHRVEHKWRREGMVLSALARGPQAATVPTILAQHREHQAVLLTPMRGQPADTLVLSDSQRRQLHNALGRFRAALDTVPIDPADPLPLADAIARRHASWCARARKSLDASRLSRAEQQFDPSVFADCTRVWCHRDLAPYNCIVDTQGSALRVAVIDFGQARPDIGLVDVLTLMHSEWVDRPPLADAFWEGYGQRPTAQVHEQLRQLSIVHGVATAAWGDKHGDAGFSALGRKILDRVLR